MICLNCFQEMTETFHDCPARKPTVPATEGATERRSGKEGSRLIAHAPDNRCKISGAHAERDFGAR